MTLKISRLVNPTLLFAAMLLLSSNAFAQEAQQETEQAASQNTSSSVTKESLTAKRSSTSNSVLDLRWRPNSDAPPPATQADSDGWRFEIAPYLWAAALKGDLRVRTTTAHVDASFSDLFNQLDFAFATRFEAAKGRWRLIVDENYMNLGTTGTGPLGLSSVEVEPTLNFFEVAGSYELVSVPNKESTAGEPLPAKFSMEVLGGARYTHFGLGLEPANLPAVEGSRNLIDAFFGNRFKFRPRPAVTLIGKYTVGAGGSNDAETVTGLVDFKLRKRLSFWAGYQYLHMSADKPENVVGFNGSMRGIILGATLHR